MFAGAVIDPEDCADLAQLADADLSERGETLPTSQVRSENLVARQAFTWRSGVQHSTSARVGVGERSQDSFFQTKNSTPEARADRWCCPRDFMFQVYHVWG